MTTDSLHIERPADHARPAETAHQLLPIPTAPLPGSEWDARGGERARVLYREVATSCRKCGRTAIELDWLYHENAELAWDEVGDDAGWVSFCRRCSALNEFFHETHWP